MLLDFRMMDLRLRFCFIVDGIDFSGLWDTERIED